MTEGSRTKCPPSLLALRGVKEGLWGLHPKVEKVSNKNREDLLNLTHEGKPLFVNAAPPTGPTLSHLHILFSCEVGIWEEWGCVGWLILELAL